MATIIGAMVWYFPTRNGIEEIISRNFPVRAVNYLRNHPVPGRMYNTYGYGGHLNLGRPEQKVFYGGTAGLFKGGGAFSESLAGDKVKRPALAALCGTCCPSRLSAPASQPPTAP